MSNSDAVTLELEGRITAYTAAPIWRAAVDTLERNPARPIVVDASRLEYVDDVGVALLFDLARRERAPHAQVEIRALPANFAALVSRFEPSDFIAPVPVRRSLDIIEQIGRGAEQQLTYVRQLTRFVAGCARAFRGAL